MSGYDIDQQVLLDSARALDQAAESLRVGLRALGDAGRIDLGTADLDTAATALVRRCTETLRRAATDVTATGDGLRVNLARYTDAEDHVAGLLRPGGPT